jgi:hypothetical protein
MICRLSWDRSILLECPLPAVASTYTDVAYDIGGRLYAITHLIALGNRKDV